MTEDIKMSGIAVPLRVKVKKSAFTLAEMMVVMLILSIVMAAFAPVMTRKSKVDLSSPWKWIEGTSDIRYGIGNANQMALIGRPQRPNNASGRLLINTGNNAVNHIMFQNNSATTGALRMNGTSLLLGSLYNDAENTGDLGGWSVGIGANVKPGNSSVAIGYNALKSNTEGSENIAIGYEALS